MNYGLVWLVARVWFDHKLMLVSSRSQLMAIITGKTLTSWDQVGLNLGYGAPTLLMYPFKTSPAPPNKESTKILRGLTVRIGWPVGIYREDTM